MTASILTNEMLGHLKNRQFGTDALLDERSAMKRAADAVKVSMIPQFVTKIETVTKRIATDSGSDEIVAKAYTERDACLVTVTNWDVVPDKETLMRTKIVPVLAKFNLDASTSVVLQFLDSNGQPMRYVPSPTPKAIPPEALG